MKTRKMTPPKLAANYFDIALDRLETRSRLEKILVPIDFSSRSKKALQYAIHFAKQGNAFLHLLHILPTAAETEHESESRLKLKAWAQEFVPSEIPAQIQVGAGTSLIEILNEARKLRADLMIVSTHGRVGRAHALAGSLAERLVQLSPCPVLVVHEYGHDFIDFKKFGNQSNEEVLPDGIIERIPARDFFAENI